MTTSAWSPNTKTHVAREHNDSSLESSNGPTNYPASNEAETKASNCCHEVERPSTCECSHTPEQSDNVLLGRSAYHEQGHGHHDRPHSHFSSHSKCCSFDETDGWSQYLPHSHGLNSRLAADKQTLIMAFIILFFTCMGQLAAGFLASSSVLAVEAIHTALDGLTVVLSLIAVVVAARPPTLRMSYGYARAETLSALVSVGALGLLCVKLLVDASERLWYILRGQRSSLRVSGRIIFIAEGVTLAANMLMTAVLSRKRLQSNSERDIIEDISRAIASVGVNAEEENASAQESLNIRALRAHIIADSVENIIVLLAGGIMWAIPRASIVDPILTVLIVILLIYLNMPIVSEALDIVLQATPSSIDARALSSELSNVQHVSGPTSLHVWTLTSGRPVGTALLTVESKADILIVERVRADARGAFAQHGVTDVTIEVRRGNDVHDEGMKSACEMQIDPVGNGIGGSECHLNIPLIAPK